MPRPEVVIEVSSHPRLAQDLAAGGVFVRGRAYKLNDECELVVRNDRAEARLIARVVYSDAAAGTGFELVRMDEEVKQQLMTVIGERVTLPTRRLPTAPPPMRSPTPVPVARKKVATPPSVPVAPPVSTELPEPPPRRKASTPPIAAPIADDVPQVPRRKASTPPMAAPIASEPATEPAVEPTPIVSEPEPIAADLAALIADDLPADPAFVAEEGSSPAIVISLPPPADGDERVVTDDELAIAVEAAPSDASSEAASPESDAQPEPAPAPDADGPHTERIELPEAEEDLELTPPPPPDSPPADTLELDPMDEPSQELAADVEEQVNKASGGDAKFARNIHERLRGLTLQQQVRMAQSGRDSERIILERMYGKNVWEPLLRNPRLTPPEVARIARMGALPRPLIEIICGNGAWLQVPEVRRALLSNPRLGTDQIMKVLRLTPKHELRIVPQQTAYSMAVRDVARKLLRTSP